MVFCSFHIRSLGFTFKLRTSPSELLDCIRPRSLAAIEAEVDKTCERLDGEVLKACKTLKPVVLKVVASWAEECRHKPMHREKPASTQQQSS